MPRKTVGTVGGGKEECVPDYEGPIGWLHWAPGTEFAWHCLTIGLLQGEASQTGTDTSAEMSR